MNKAKPEDVNIGLVGFRITRILTDYIYAQVFRGTGSLPPPLRGPDPGQAPPGLPTARQGSCPRSCVSR